MNDVISYSMDDIKEFDDVCKSRARKLLGRDWVETVLGFILWVAIAIGLLSTFSFYRSAPEYRTDILIIIAYILIVAAIFITIRFYRNLRFNAIRCSENGIFLTSKTIEFADNCIVFSSKYGEQRYAYECFFDYVVHRRNIYLFIDNFQALIIPLSICNEELIRSKLSAIP